MLQFLARGRIDAPDETIEGGSEDCPDPEISTLQHIAAVKLGNRKGYRRFFMGALVALGIVAAIPRSVSPIPLMARAKLEAVDHKHGLDKKEIEWRAQLQKMADENRYEELDISEFFENLQLLAWGVDPDSVETANEIMNDIANDMIRRAQIHIPQKDIVTMLAAKIAEMKHSQDQNSTAYMMTGEEIEGKPGGNCVARFGALASLYARAFPAYAEFMRMDVRKWEEYGKQKAHIALYINGRAFLPFSRGAGLTEDWYIVDNGILTKARRPPSHVEVTLKRALVDSFLAQDSVWTQERVWVPTDRREPPERENPIALYDREAELNAGGYPNSDTQSFEIERRIDGPVVISTKTEGTEIKELVIIGVRNNEERIIDRVAVNGGPMIAACYDFTWGIIDERRSEPTDVRFQLLDGRELKEWSDPSARRETLKAADHIAIIGEASNEQARVNGKIYFGVLQKNGPIHSREFACFLKNTGTPRELIRPTGAIDGWRGKTQTSTWEVTRFVLKDGPAETTTPLGDGLWGKDDIEK